MISPVKGCKGAEVPTPAAAHVDAHVCRLVQQVARVVFHLQSRRPQGGLHTLVGALRQQSPAGLMKSNSAHCACTANTRYQHLFDG